MALREFRDTDGRSWRVWDILPEQLDERTRAEDYLQGFLEGWLVFESADGRDKCRLHPIPAKWVMARDEDLRRLLRQAEPVRGKERQHLGQASGIRPPRPAEARHEMRTVRYPGGRYWTIHEWLVDVPGRMGEVVDRRVVLRFACGTRRLELFAFPRNWTEYSDEQLAELLHLAFPRDPSKRNPTSHARRRDDPRAER